MYLSGKPFAWLLMIYPVSCSCMLMRECVDSWDIFVWYSGLGFMVCCKFSTAESKCMMMHVFTLFWTDRGTNVCWKLHIIHNWKCLNGEVVSGVQMDQNREWWRLSDVIQSDSEINGIQRTDWKDQQFKLKFDIFSCLKRILCHGRAEWRSDTWFNLSSLCRTSTLRARSSPVWRKVWCGRPRSSRERTPSRRTVKSPSWESPSSPQTTSTWTATFTLPAGMTESASVKMWECFMCSFVFVEPLTVRNVVFCRNVFCFLKGKFHPKTTH